VLAADDMEGRATFTPSAERAADFIAGEFAAAGLETVPAADGYLQRFAMYAYNVREASVSVGGTALATADVAARVSAESISWSTGDAEVVVVGAGDDLRSSLVPILQRESGNVLVLLDPAHRELFEGQLGRYIRSPFTTTEPGAANLVVAVTAAEAGAQYEVSVQAEETESPLMNVVGVIPGNRSNEIVLFAGHYDHVGVRAPVDGDSIFNGANDNASGTTAVISLAKYYAQRGTPERTLMFVAFAAEEMGGYGSQHFSEQLDPDQIVAMFNMEMIGKPAVEGPNTAWITGFERSSFGTILQEAVEGTGYEFYPDPYPSQNLFYRSDNATLARLGVPAHSISTTPIDVDPDYHRPSDEVETLDLDHLTNTIRAIALGAETIVTGVATPTRVDPATVR
jgi:Iap family predicted aminopeptidase